MEKMNKKILIFAILFLFILMSTALILSKNLTNFNRPAIFSHTKAICNSTNFCIDYEIHCENEKITKMNPITGAVVQFPSTWQDPRDNLTRNKNC